MTTTPLQGRTIKEALRDPDKNAKSMTLPGKRRLSSHDNLDKTKVVQEWEAERGSSLALSRTPGTLMSEEAKLDSPESVYEGQRALC